jgi:hypothetical protein
MLRCHLGGDVLTVLERRSKYKGQYAKSGKSSKCRNCPFLQEDVLKPTTKQSENADGK